MQIFFQIKNLNINEHTKSFVANRLGGLAKFFSPQAHAYVDLEKTRASHNGRDLYYSAITIQDGPTQYFADEYKDDLRKSFDHAYSDVFRIVRNERSRSRTLFNRAGRKFKNIFKKKYK